MKSERLARLNRRPAWVPSSGLQAGEYGARDRGVVEAMKPAAASGTRAVWTIPWASIFARLSLDNPRFDWGGRRVAPFHPSRACSQFLIAVFRRSPPRNTRGDAASAAASLCVL